FDRAEDAMVVGRHLVEPGPRAFGIDRDILEAGHAVSGADENLLDERRLEVSLVAGGFVGVVPRQEESEAFGSEVEAVAHVDDHGNFVRDGVERFGRNQHAAQRLNGKIDAGQSRYLCRPRTSRVDHDARAYGTARGFYAGDARGVAMNG